jgi:hypothetical protein
MIKNVDDHNEYDHDDLEEWILTDFRWVVLTFDWIMWGKAGWVLL